MRGRAITFTTVYILFLSGILQCYKSSMSKNHTATLFITHLFACRIPCTHNAWAADNLTPLGMLFLSIIA